MARLGKLPHSNRSARRAALVAIATTAIGLPALRAAIIRVGPVGDPACDQNTIALALFQAAFNGENDEIRLARNLTYANQYLHLTSFPDLLTIRGGYDDCADDAPNGSTEVTGRTDQPVVEIDGTTASNVVLHGLRLVVPAGGVSEVVRVEQAGQVTIPFGVLTGGQDGGLTIQGAAARAELGFSALVENNEGFSGGGVECGTGGAIEISGVVRNNTASANGGGIFAVESCQITLLNGAWVQSNEAGFDGGGIYLGSGADLVSTGGAGAGARIFDNVAGDQGGGIFAQMAATSALLRNTWIKGNLAGNAGGGLYAFNQASIVTDRLAGDCLDPVRCSVLSENELEDGTSGSAAYAAGGATITLNQTFVEGNVVPEPQAFGSVLYATGVGSQVKTESVQIWGNTGADTVFEAQAAALAWATFTTSGLNPWDDGGTPREANGFYLGNDGDGRINTSVFWPTAGHTVSTATGSMFTQVDCLVTSTMTGLPAGAEFVTLVDPQYLDPLDGDLRPRAGSPVVDYCDTFRYAPTQADILFAGRGHDHALNPNGAPGVSGGVQDAGAYEQHELFADGFESGDTSRWSSTAP